MYYIFQIAKTIKAHWLQQADDMPVEHILLDSRKMLFPNSSIFFSLNGPVRKGNAFIGELFAKGVRNFVVDELFVLAATEKFEHANFMQVKDVLQALHLLSSFHRRHFHIPVTGITGSNGKTIVKEWLYQLLQPDYEIVRSPKSYNSQIGVPLSVWQMNAQHTLGIFEAGISRPDEMAYLEKIIEPSIGVFTNIGEAHSEGFLNIRQKINEKLKLFVKCKQLVYNADSPDISEAVNAFVNVVRNDGSLQLFTWGKKETASLQIVSVQKEGTCTHITATLNDAEKNSFNKKGSLKKITIPFTDEAAVENAINCWCVLLLLGTSDIVTAERMRCLRAVEMRLELKKGINQCAVINDSYSADINSLTIALDFLLQQRQHTKRTVILSDILQSGKESAALYRDVAAILKQKKINRFIGVGPQILQHKDAFKNMDQTFFFTSTEAFKNNFYSIHFHNESILLKGARIFEFEQISHLLEEKVHQTVLEINLNAIIHNLKQYQQQLNPAVKLMAMVKAFSYGSGSFEIASLLQFHKVDYLAVAYADEGVELRRAGIALPIMVMSPEENTFDVMVQYNLEPELYTFSILNAFSRYLHQNGIKNYPVHIKLDTGMHRLGFEEQDMPQLTVLLKASTVFKIQSVFSHLAASGSSLHDDFTKQQAAIFLHCCNALQAVLDYPFIKHIANTSAIKKHRELQFDMVRLGIGMYGVDDDDAMQHQVKNVTTLKTTIAQIKNVKAGDTVGYNRMGKITSDSVIATVRIGYADGYPRILGNGNGKMWVNGTLARVTGNVCMDMLMLDVTGIDVKEGDEVIVFGEQLGVSELAAWAGTIAYEILAGISQRVKRVYFEE